MVNEIVPHFDAAGEMACVFARDLDPEIACGNEIPLDDDVRAPIDVDAVRAPVVRETVPVGGVPHRVDIPHRISPANAVARPILRAVGTGALEPDEIDSDVVIVVHAIVRHPERFHVAVERHRLARTSFETVNLVAIDDEIADGLDGRSPVNSNPQRIRRDAVEGVFDAVNLVVEQLNVMRGARDVNSRGHRVLAAGLVIADIESADEDIGFACHKKQGALIARRDQSGAIDHRCFARISPKGDEASGRRTGDFHRHALIVCPRADQNGVAWGEGVGGLLDRSPWLGDGAGIRIQARDRDVIRGGTKLRGGDEGEEPQKGRLPSVDLW